MLTQFMSVIWLSQSSSKRGVYHKGVIKNIAIHSLWFVPEYPLSGVHLLPAGRTHSTIPALKKGSAQRTTHIVSPRERGREMMQALLLPLTHVANPKGHKNPSMETFTTWRRPLIGVRALVPCPHMPFRKDHHISQAKDSHGWLYVLSLSSLNLLLWLSMATWVFGEF